MVKIPAGVSAIVFDLGGVIVDLSVQRTIEAFAQLSGFSPKKIAEAYTSFPEFFAYERGQITDEQFRIFLRNFFKPEASDNQLDACWNAMLVDLPSEKLQLLKKLQQHYKVYALSNTNNIHIRYVNEVMLNGEELDAYFTKAYYSHKVRMRKPDAEIYEFVMSDAALLPGNILFFDDNAANIATAQSLGIHAVEVEHPNQVYDYFAL